MGAGKGDCEEAEVGACVHYSADVGLAAPRGGGGGRRTVVVLAVAAKVDGDLFGLRGGRG